MRKVSISPFADLEKGMERLGEKVVVFFKPNSNHLSANAPSYDLLEEELTRACKCAQKYGNSVEMIFKTIITLRGEPQRLWKCCEIAANTIDGFYN